MQGKRQKGDGHQGLERMALKGSFLEAIDPKDGQKQGQVRQGDQERTEFAPASLGLARVEALVELRSRMEAGPSGRGRIGEKPLVKRPLRFPGDQALIFRPHGSAPFSAHQVHGRRLDRRLSVTPVAPAGHSHADRPIMTTRVSRWDERSGLPDRQT
jgi:hypothetical protein